MRAAVVERLGTPLVAKDVERPAIGPRDVLLEVKACGICYTDLGVIDALGGPALPLIPGQRSALSLPSALSSPR
jgi:D-arabinose 1-dehydrogenase-like Zn-dependent alcohol dehydrogenase